MRQRLQRLPLSNRRLPQFVRLTAFECAALRGAQLFARLKQSCQLVTVTTGQLVHDPDRNGRLPKLFDLGRRIVTAGLLQAPG